MSTVAEGLVDHMKHLAAAQGHRVVEGEGGTLSVVTAEGRSIYRTTRRALQSYIPRAQERVGLNRALARAFWTDGLHGGFW